MKRTIGIIVLVVVVAVAAFYLGRSTQGAAPVSEQKLAFKAFPGAEKHEITLAEAKEAIKNYQLTLEKQALKGAQKKGSTPRCGTFDRAAFDKLLAQPGCAAIRYYNAQHADGNLSLVIVGVDTSGKDMTRAMIIDRPTFCPPWCDITSELVQ